MINLFICSNNFSLELFIMILFFAFFAGILSVLAPCVLPLLPVLLWGGLARGNKYSPYIILISALFFIFICTLLFKVVTGFLPIKQEVLVVISAVIIWVYGILLLFPQLWDRFKFLFPQKASKSIKKTPKTWIRSEILLGASLGPLFASCSPTYALIISTILPASLFMGTLSILVYLLGFWLVIFLIIYFGKEFLQKLTRYANPDGIFKKIIGGILLLTSILIISGGFKWLEAQLVNSSLGTGLTRIEKNAIRSLN